MRWEEHEKELVSPDGEDHAQAADRTFGKVVIGV